MIDMGGAKQAIKTAVITLAVIWVFNQVSITRQLTQRALTGQ